MLPDLQPLFLILEERPNLLRAMLATWAYLRE